jgi:malate dehydrogenase
MVPDVSQGTVNGQAIAGLVGADWLGSTFDSTVRTRGKAIINARGKSSAASAAFAAIDHIHDWYLGTGENRYVSMAVPSDGSYGIPEGLIYSFPCRITGPWQYEIVRDLPVDAATQARMNASTAELLSEREAVAHLL